MQSFKENYEEFTVYEAGDMNEHMQIIEYAPALFREIRKQYNINSEFFFKSFAPAFNF